MKIPSNDQLDKALSNILAFDKRNSIADVEESLKYSTNPKAITLFKATRLIKLQIDLANQITVNFAGGLSDKQKRLIIKLDTQISNLNLIIELDSEGFELHIENFILDLLS